MMYDSGLPGQWVDFMEIEAVFDDFRATVDSLEEYPAARRSPVVRARLAAIRSTLDDVQTTLQRMARVGIMAAAIPVYNLGIVDQPGGEPRPRGSKAGAAGQPPVENWGGGPQ